MLCAVRAIYWVKNKWEEGIRRMKNFTIIGAGAWGTALATSLTRAGAKVTIWARESDVVESITKNHENTMFLSGVKLDKTISATNDMANAVQADGILLVSPAQFSRSTMQAMKSAGLAASVPVILCCKGVEQNSLKLMTEVAEEELDNPILVLSGPTFASEVARGLPASATLAGVDGDLVERVKEAISSHSFKVFPNSDVIGAEIGGAVKNVIAIACGIAQGSGLGESAKAALIVRGLREMKRICEAKGGDPDTLMHLCGVGDLILTANSQESRNFSLGYQLGQGESLAAIMDSRHTVAEGVASAESVVALGKKLGVDLPICEVVFRIVHGQEDIKETIEELVRES